jgi:hypothetical protein
MGQLRSQRWSALRAGEAQGASPDHRGEARGVSLCERWYENEHKENQVEEYDAD